MTDRASKWAAIVVGVAILLTTSGAECKAQSFSFAVGSGGGGHCHHHHHHRGGWSVGYGFGPYWGPAWYAPPPIVYAPPPVVQPIYIQPQTIQPITPSASHYSAAIAPPATTVAADKAPSLAGSVANDDRIVIRNASGAQLPVSFLVDGQDMELGDGVTRTFVGKTRRVVQYDRGGRFGSTQQDLTGGQYEFRVTASGWDLVRKPDFNPAARTAVRSNSLPEGNVR